MDSYHVFHFYYIFLKMFFYWLLDFNGISAIIQLFSHGNFAIIYLFSFVIFQMINLFSRDFAMICFLQLIFDSFIFTFSTKDSFIECDFSKDSYILTSDFPLIFTWFFGDIFFMHDCAMILYYHVIFNSFIFRMWFLQCFIFHMWFCHDWFISCVFFFPIIHLFFRDFSNDLFIYILFSQWFIYFHMWFIQWFIYFSTWFPPKWFIIIFTFSFFHGFIYFHIWIF